METIPLGELNHHPARVTARVRAGETIVLTEHGRPVIRMSPAAEPTSVLERLIAEGLVRRSPHRHEMPELIDDLQELPSLAELLVAERDEERHR
jgi:prevent-host-death family protein